MGFRKRTTVFTHQQHVEPRTESVQRRRNTCRTISQNQDIRFKVIHLSLQKDYAIVSLMRDHPSSGIWAPITCTTSLETILPRLPERSMSQPFM